MYYIVSSMSFPVYMLVTIGVFILAFFSIFDMRKKKPGHPMIWMLPFAMITDAFLIAYRCIIEFSANTNLQKGFYIATIVSIILFVISTIVTFIIADKKNYTAKGKKAKYAKSTLISSGIAFVIGVMVIIIGYIIRENNLL